MPGINATRSCALAKWYLGEVSGPVAGGKFIIQHVTEQSAHCMLTERLHDLFSKRRRLDHLLKQLH